MNDAPRLRLRAYALHRRRIPFRFGFHVAGNTIDSAEQIFARVRIETEDGVSAWGAAAEAPAPIWFDKKRPLEETARDLLDSVRHTADSYRDADATAFGLSASAYAGQLAWARGRGAPDTVGSFGPALLDRAVLDALCRARGLSIFQAVRANLPGMTTALCPDLSDFDLDAFLASLTPVQSIAARHTIGGHDPLTRAEIVRPVGDGLPESLDEVIAAYGHRHFKIKIGPDRAETLDRLRAIASVLERIGQYWITLDGNEGFGEAAEIKDMVEALSSDPALRRMRAGLLYVEQPIAREKWGDEPVPSDPAVIIDESDGTLDDFPRARGLKYRGTSAKTCKGLYKALLNAARCAHWADGSFMAAEDLNHPAGLSLQQDLAIAGLLGLGHCERNGQHYMNGMAAAPRNEQQAFLAAHPDLYQEDDGTARLKIVDGMISLLSLNCPGFAGAAEPDWSSMEAL